MISFPLKKPDLYDISVHKGRMLLIDQIDSCDRENFTMESSLQITDESEFLYEGAMPVWVSFEYMAQSIALLSSVVRRENNEEPEIGFLINVRDFEAVRPEYKIGDRVTIRISQEFKEENIAVFHGESFVNGECYSKGSVTVIEKTDELLNKWSEK